MSREGGERKGGASEADLKAGSGRAVAGRDARRRGRRSVAADGGAGPFGFGIANYAAFVAGFAAIVAGYVQLDRGSVTAAPILLILGYAVLLPLALLLGWRGLDRDR